LDFRKLSPKALVSHSDRRGAASGLALLAAPPHGLIQINTRRRISD
jgi:hypothetical protein